MIAKPDRQVFTKSPLREVVLDIRLSQAPEITIEHLMKAELTKPLPQVTRYESQTDAPSDVTRTLQSAASTKGLLFSEPSNRVYLQLTLDSFTLSLLAPYSGWEYLRSSSRSLFEFYASNTKPLQITRIGLRYINNLIFQTNLLNFEDALTVFPRINIGKDPLTEFYMRIRIPQQSLTDTQLVLTESSLSAPVGQVSLLLDIDVFRKGIWPPTAIDELFGAFEALHALGYQTFIDSTTDAYRASIQ